MVAIKLAPTAAAGEIIRPLTRFDRTVCPSCAEFCASMQSDGAMGTG